jgi:hypothetical protein
MCQDQFQKFLTPWENYKAHKTQGHNGAKLESARRNFLMYMEGTVCAWIIWHLMAYLLHLLRDLIFLEWKVRKKMSLNLLETLMSSIGLLYVICLKILIPFYPSVLWIARSINLLKIDINSLFYALRRQVYNLLQEYNWPMILWLQLLHRHGMSIVYISVGLMLIFFNT